MNDGPLIPVGLRCAHKNDPFTVELDRVRFSWRVAGTGAGRHQTAYQIRVGAVPVDLEDGPGVLWDSGRTDLDSSSGIPYEGAPLMPACRYQWMVRVWDEADRQGPWSSVGTFGTGLGPDRDWEGCYWIGLGRGGSFAAPADNGPVDTVAVAMEPAPYLRRAFSLDKDMSSARLYATALGVYELFVNGRRVSGDVLEPGWTDYGRRLLYQSYDVTDLLDQGENVIGAIVGDGWACGFYGFDAKRAGAHYAGSPRFLAQLVVDFTDGTKQRVCTDEAWSSTTGAIVYADMLMGERRDGQREPRGWDGPGYDASSWRGVSCGPRDGRALLADPGPPIRVTQELGAKSVRPAKGGGVVVDFGQNLAGWVRLKVDEPPGTLVRVRHAEVLAEDGELYVDNLRSARQTDVFATVGVSEVLEPRFTFHGFRYAEISGLSGDLSSSDIIARVVGSDTPRTGSFDCSSREVTRLYENIDWGQRSNFISVPTDCPQRDERLGWLGDAQIFVRTAAYNRDVAAFLDKWLDDVRDAQLPSGAFTDFAPSLGYDWAGAPAWGDAGVIVPWTIYKMYGDKTVLQRNFEAMAAWMAFIASTNPGRLRVRELGQGYGDWLAPKGDSTPIELLATAYWAYDASLMAETCVAVGRPKEAAMYEQLAQEIREAFAEAYVGPSGRIEPETQTAYALALHMDLVPGPLRAHAAAYLVDAIARENWHLSTGFVGVGYLLPVLSSNGYTAVAYRLLEQRSFPSWQYTIDRGATTIWERWDGWTEESGFQSPHMNSFNHYSLGSVGEWLYRFVLGIELAPGAAGFDRVVIRPHPGGSLDYARGAFESVRGEISTTWARDGSRFTLSVQIPPNVRASVRVPSARPLEVVGGDGMTPKTVGVYPGSVGQMEAVFEVGSGAYSFSGPDLALGGVVPTAEGSGP